MRRIRPILVLLATVALAASCATAATPAAAPAGESARTSTDEPGDDHLGDDHADHGGAPDTGEVDGGDAAAGPGTTAATLAQLRSLDPDVLASAHRHDHGDHTPREHPNGIRPDRIVIPAIEVDADVIELGLEDDGSMEVPTDFAQTGWFAPGPQPGRVGPAVIAGHVDDRSGPAVFHELSRLQPGDRIEVHGEGDTVVFEVRETQQHPKDAFPTAAVYGGTPGPELRLITCSGEFDRSERSYRDNTIVFAERVDA